MHACIVSTYMLATNQHQVHRGIMPCNKQLNGARLQPRHQLRGVQLLHSASLFDAPRGRHSAHLQSIILILLLEPLAPKHGCHLPLKLVGGHHSLEQRPDVLCHNFLTVTQHALDSRLQDNHSSKTMLSDRTQVYRCMLGLVCKTTGMPEVAYTALHNTYTAGNVMEARLGGRGPTQQGSCHRVCSLSCGVRCWC